MWHTITLIACLMALYIPYSNNASLDPLEQKKYKQFLEGQGLYGADDDVFILTANNFNKEIVGSQKAWLVEFYNSWCGFCQRFAPSWKALATDLKGWHDLVVIAAIDCSDDENAPLCREYEIMGYPTLKYFHENFQTGPQKLGIGVSKGEDVSSHKHFLIETLVNEQLEGRGQIYPNLLPYTHSDLSSLFNKTLSEVLYGFLVIEEPNSRFGAEVSLDLHKTTNVVVRYGFSNNTQLSNTLQITGFPAVVVLSKGNNRQILKQNVPGREQIKETIKKFLQDNNIKVTDEPPREIFTGKWLDAEVPDMADLIQARANQVLKERLKKMGDLVFQMDLESALRYSLKHEIATVKTITGDQLLALRAYLEVLREVFPFGPAGRLFLTEMSVKVGVAESVQGSAIAESVKAAEDGNIVFSAPHQWLACKGSSPSFRGYPCGLWKMFHYMTVNWAEQNRFNKQADPKHVLITMHAYIKNFFGCADCSKHFQQMAHQRDMMNVSTADSAILWLWMAHNQVNKRLAGDQTEDPEYPKYQFPSKEHCSACRKSDETWDLVEVLNYIKHMYNSLNVRYIGSDTRILHVGLNGENVKSSATRRDGGFFNAVDSSMCFILYVCSFLLLAVLIRIFLKRGRYRKKPYVHDLLGKV